MYLRNVELENKTICPYSMHSLDVKITPGVCLRFVYIVSFQEIINDIAEKGAQFTESEYSQLLRLMGRSQPGTDPAVLSSRITRLRETLQNLQNESGWPGT